MEKKKVLVVGGGFGGVFAAKELAEIGRDQFDIELVNNNNYFVFQPLLPEVAASTIHSSDAVVPLRQLLRGVQIRQAEVMGIDFDRKSRDRGAGLPPHPRRACLTTSSSSRSARPSTSSASPVSPSTR